MLNSQRRQTDAVVFYVCLNVYNFYDKINGKERGFIMKGLLKLFGFTGIAVLAGGAAAVAAPAGGIGVNEAGLCALIGQMYGVFKILRTLAFVGAAFIIAGWAWGYISKGEVKLDDLQKKGTGMLVGFVLLFGIGVVLQFFLFSSTGLGIIGCSNLITNW